MGILLNSMKIMRIDHHMDAMHRFDSDKWLKAMKYEIEPMKVNDVWTLVNPPEGIKSIGCKWIFKRKRSTNKKMKTYKAHLVAKGYRQHYGIDYDEIFLLWQCSSPFGLCLR